MKKRWIIFFVVLFFLFIPNTYAVCNDSELAQKMLIADNVIINYQNIEKENFNLVISNLTEDLFLIDDTNQKYIYGTNDILTLNNYIAGNTYSFRVFSKSGTCKNIKIATKVITLPKYNSFSEDEYCLEHPDFKYCDPWCNEYLDASIIADAINEYEDNFDNQLEINWLTLFINGIVDFIVANYVFVIGGGVIVIIVITIIIAKRRKTRKEIKI